MDVYELVKAHYGIADLETPILRGLAENGVDASALTVEDVAPVDQLHAGGLPATRHLLAQLDLRPGVRLLDVGCGIGGPSRAAVAYHSCRVVGVDLTPEFVAAATSLTGRVGLWGEFRCARGDALPFEAGAFERAMMVHVGMNIADKKSVFADVRRVLAPGGLFGLFEQMRVGEGILPYPLPWAEDERFSFVERVEQYVDQLTEAGFAIEKVEDRTAEAGGPPPAGAGIGPQVIFGPRFAERVANNVAATKAGILAPVLIIARVV